MELNSVLHDPGRDTYQIGNLHLHNTLQLDTKSTLFVHHEKNYSWLKTILLTLGPNLSNNNILKKGKIESTSLEFWANTKQI